VRDQFVHDFQQCLDAAGFVGTGSGSILSVYDYGWYAGDVVTPDKIIGDPDFLIDLE
jgi:hypothetical protein